MKKLLALVLALVMVFALAACGSGESTPTTDPNAGASTTPSGDDTPNVEPVTNQPRLHEQLRQPLEPARGSRDGLL